MQRKCYTIKTSAVSGGFYFISQGKQNICNELIHWQTDEGKYYFVKDENTSVFLRVNPSYFYAGILSDSPTCVLFLQLIQVTTPYVGLFGLKLPGSFSKLYVR